MRRQFRSLLVGALFSGALVVGGGIPVANADHCADGDISFSGTVSSGVDEEDSPIPYDTTVHLMVGPYSEAPGAWVDFNLATADWLNLFTYAEEREGDEGLVVGATGQTPDDLALVMDAQDFSAGTTDGAYEMCVSVTAMTILNGVMAAMNSGGSGSGGEDSGGGGDGEPMAVRRTSFNRPLVGGGSDSPQMAFQVVALADLTDWTPGPAEAPPVGTTGSALEVMTEASSYAFEDIAMQEATVWGEDALDVATDMWITTYDRFGASAFVANAPFSSVEPSKFAFAVTFSPDELGFSFYGGSFTETTFARNLALPSPDSTVMGYVTNGNLSGTIVDPDGGALPDDTRPDFLYAELYVGEGQGGGMLNELIDFSSIGRVDFWGNVAPGETFKISASVEGYSPAECFVTNNDGVLEVPVSPASTGCEFVEGELEITLGAATAPIKITDESGATIGGLSSVSIGEEGYGWFNDENYNTSDDGIASWSPYESGWYRLKVTPPTDEQDADSALYVLTQWYLEVLKGEDLDGDGELDEGEDTNGNSVLDTEGIRILDVCSGWEQQQSSGIATGCTDTELSRTDGNFVFELPLFDDASSEHVRFTVTAGDDIVENAVVRIEELSGGWPRYLFEAEGNNLGVLAATLPPGRYQATAGPSWREPSSGLAQEVVEFCMDETYGPTNCFGTAFEGNNIDIGLPVPNVSIVAWLDEIDGTPSRWTWVLAEYFDPLRNMWSQAASTSTNSSGEASLNLDSSGVPYRIKVQAPWGSDVGDIRFFLRVETDGVCEVANESVTACELNDDGDPIYDTEIVKVHPLPNFRGRVMAGGVGAQAWVNGMKWNGSWFDGSNGFWFQTNYEGEFARAIDEEGIYKLEVNPFDWQSGYSKVEKLVEFADLGDGTLSFCEPDVNEFQAPVPCDRDDETLWDSDELTITLRGANFGGRVLSSIDIGTAGFDTDTDDDGVNDADVVRWAWVQMVLPQEWGGWTYLTSAGSNHLGEFRQILEWTGAVDWTEVVVEVNPPWGGDTGLVKVRRSYWIKTSDTGTDICRIDPADTEDVCGADDIVDVDNDGLETFVLGAGNLVGDVTSPLGAEPYVNIQVEKKISQDWNGDGTEDGFWWEHVNLFGQSSSTGRYSLDVLFDVPSWNGQYDLIQGDYRVTARPWGRTDVAEKSVEFCVVQVDGVDLIDADCDDDVDPSEVEEVDIELPGPNIIGSVETAGGTLVPNAWLALEEQYTYDWNSDGTVDWTSWNWAGVGGQTNGVGEFVMFREATSDPKIYRLRVNAPWNWAGDPLVNFTSEPFCLSRDVSDSCDLDGDGIGDIAAIDELDTDLAFPAPKLQLTVKTPDGDAVPWAWLSVEKKETQYWGPDVLNEDTDGDGVLDEGEDTDGDGILNEPGDGQADYIWDWWQWQDAWGSTNLQGKVALNPTLLDLDTSDLDDWRITVNPPWNGSNGENLPQFTVLLSALEAPVGGTIIDNDVRFPSANLTGTAYIDLGDDSVLRWGWISVESFTWNDGPDDDLVAGDSNDDWMSNFQWVGGTNTNNDGELSMRVAEAGTYLIRVHSSGWGGDWKAPIELIATFEEDGGDIVLVNWVYRSALDDEQCDVDEDDPCVFDPDFAHIPPNVYLTITADGAQIETGSVGVVLVDENGQEIALSANGGTGGIEFPLLIAADGTYDVYITWVRKVAGDDELSCDLLLDELIDVNPGGTVSTTLNIDTDDGFDCANPEPEPAPEGGEG